MLTISTALWTGILTSGVTASELRTGYFIPSLEVEYDLEKCIDLAVTQNHILPVQRHKLRIAELQHRQALSAYWPQLSANLGAQRIGQDVVIRQAASSFEIPGGTLPAPATSFSLPANALGPGFPPAAVQIPVQAGGITIPASRFDVPASDLKLLDRDVLNASLDLKWLLLDMGERSGRAELAKAGIEAARQEDIEATLQIVFDVYRYYEGAVLANQLLDLAETFQARMQAALDLTKSMYEGGSELVDKTDYLRNKVLVEATDSTMQQLRANRELALAALANVIGMDWDVRVTPATKTLQFEPLEMELPGLITELYELNPDWQRMAAGLDAAKAGASMERGRRLPRLALIGKINRGDPQGAGAVDSNLDNWMLGVGLEIPLFSGFLNQSKMREAQARVAQRKAESVMLEKGLATKMKHLFIQSKSADQRAMTLAKAAATSRENRDLSERAYAANLLEAGPMFEAIMLESFMEAALLRNQYEAVLARRQIDQLSGQIIQESLFR